MTVIEVLFAMFVVLFGLIGIATLLPMAGRQASDSYSMTHGGAAMQNANAEVVTMAAVAPNPERPWWFADDEYATAPIASLGFQFDYANERRWYRSADSMQQMLWFIKQRTLPATTPYSSLQLEFARRNGRAQGFCIDPQFYGSEIAESWQYPGAYEHDRHAANQGVFRRSRMPFFDEQTGLGATSFQTNASYFFPKLMRVSFVGDSTGTRFTNPNEPLPLGPENAGVFVSSGGDLISQAAEGDQTYGPLRYFSGNGVSGFSSSPGNRRITWLATMTPTEEQSPYADPVSYELSVAAFSNREYPFEAAPIAIVKGSPAQTDDRFSLGERMCFATSPQATSVAIADLGDLCVSFNGGAFETKLWSDELTDSTIRVGDWVMLSRRIVRGNFTTTAKPTTVDEIKELKITHRHRWYRIIGVDAATQWPRTVRLMGEPWDYPEMNSVMRPGGAYVGVVPGTGSQARSLDGISAFPGWTNGMVANGNLSLVDLTTTATIFKNVVAVHKRNVTIE